MGKTNQNADCLSHIPKPLIATITSKNYTELATAQREKEYCREIIDSLENDETTSKINYQLSEINELLSKDGKLVVPERKKTEILEFNHDYMLAGHLGIVKTTARIQKHFTWHKLKEDVFSTRY